MSFLRIAFAVLLAGIIPARAQFEGPRSPGVSASLIRLFGTNTAFTARAEFQVLGPDNQERVGLPMSFARLGSRIRVEVDLARMRNREEPDALARLKPLGLDQVVSILLPDQKLTCVVFPRLRAFVKLPMPPAEAAAYLKKASVRRTPVAKEKLEGHPCIKQRVVITDDQGQHEATVWVATDLRDFPVGVATREAKDTVMMRFRQVQFTRSEAARFAPPTGYLECADMPALMAGPVVKYMKANKTATPAARKPSSSKTNRKQ